MIGFIGAGNMAGAIIRGLVQSGTQAPDQICASDPNPQALDKLARETGITAFVGNEEVVQAADTIVLAIKPDKVDAVMEEIGARIVAKNPLVVPIVAGLDLAKWDSWLGPNTPVVRVMPNINVTVGAGISAVTPNANATDQQVREVLTLFRSVGQAIELPERLFGAFTAVAGSSPAWVFLFVEALARGALAAGMPKAQAADVATAAVAGSAALLAQSPKHAWELIDMVSSPGGTTVAGLNTLEERGFSAAVIEAVRVTIARERELSQGD
jgi:pyrroline-5-carboxylate reductase